MTVYEIQRFLNAYKNLKFEDYKLSYLILKPNAAKHYKLIIDEVESNQFLILNQYAILDYETVNMALHGDQQNAMKYLIPITRMYYDFYGNYGTLILIAKKDISYENFCIQVLRLKKYLRANFELSYISYAFDTSELGEANEQQKLLILSKNGGEVKKDKMNQEGTFMIFSINEIHSPDETVENTIREMSLLKSMNLFNEGNVIPKGTINNMKRYLTFEFLKDML